MTWFYDRYAASPRVDHYRVQIAHSFYREPGLNLSERRFLFPILAYFPTVYRAFNPTPGFVFISSAMCKNVIRPYRDPNMQPFTQQLPGFICSASAGLSASCHEYLKWSFEWLNTGSDSQLWKLLPNHTVHIMLFAPGPNRVIIILPRTLIEFLDNYKKC